MSALEQYAAKIQEKQKPEWSPPTWDDFKPSLVVASFDQTFTTTGYVLMMVGNEEVHIFERDTWKPWSDATGFQMAYEKTDRLEKLLIAFILKHAPERMVYEMPVVMGKRTDSSFLAGYVFAKQRGVPISIQHSRTVLAGPQARDDKKLGHRALVDYIPASGTRQWNEHQRDAAINALGYLHDLRRQERERTD